MMEQEVIVHILKSKQPKPKWKRARERERERERSNYHDVYMVRLKILCL